MDDLHLRDAYEESVERARLGQPADPAAVKERRTRWRRPCGTCGAETGVGPDGLCHSCWDRVQADLWWEAEEVLREMREEKYG